MLPAASSLSAEGLGSIEGNTLTGLINLLRSPIHPDRPVHRFLCIAICLFISVTLAAAQGGAKRPGPPPRGVKPVKTPAPDAAAGTNPNESAAEAPAPPGAPAT